MENITLPMALAGRTGDKEWIDRIVDTVGLRPRLKHRPSELSGGQQQRVAVARALASQPEIIFADEPTGNLDSRSGAEILEFMRQAVLEFGQTIVMVTHDPTAAAYAGRVIFLATARSSTRSATRLRKPSSTRCTSWAADNMWKVTRKGLAAHKLRFVLTALA